jgi:2-keto-3-deoxy-L-rhamnonate aldolase RhmA
MIETAEALASLEEIAEVPGVTGLVAGPVDLGLAMDRPTPLRSDDAIWRQALARVVKVCEAQGLRSGMFATDAEDARLWFSLGFRDVIVSSDISFLRRAAIQQVARARETVGPEDPLLGATSADPYAGR